MSTAEKIKQLIAKQLTDFLLPNEHIPNNIEIKVSYAESNARLIIDTEKLAEVLKQ